MTRPVTIVGGGLAGLTLGIGLRQRGVPVTVWEAGHYPRHRVCGEFISGRGQGALGRLGLLEGLKALGAGTATDAAFFTGQALVAPRPLPEAALCISRFTLDRWLAQEFQRLGGELRSGERWMGDYGEGIVRASGRQAEPAAGGWRLFGLKVHARDIRLTADLEMHFGPAGYVGLCRLPDGETNVCGLFRSATAVPDLARNWRDWLGGSPGSVLRTRLAHARFDEASFCSIAGISLRARQARTRREVCVGDSLTMIPPVTGNGMSMAFESAELAMAPLGRFSRGKLDWLETRQQLGRACDAAFAPRLRWAAWLQRAMFQPPLRTALLFLVARSDTLWRGLFTHTR